MQGPSRSSRVKVVHLSTVHSPYDLRIYWKECLSLAEADYDVSFVVPVPDERPLASWCPSEKTRIIPVKRRSGRLGRMMLSTFAVMASALRQNGTLYHFHDPELVPCGLVLRLLGKRVIYDAHEDLPRDILYKHWIPLRLRRPLSRAADTLEWLAARGMSGVIAATPTIARRFPETRAAVVQNFARLSEFDGGDDVPYRKRGALIAYLGGITPERCALEMVGAVAKQSHPEARLIMAGPMSPQSLQTTLAALPGWSRVEYRGVQERHGVRQILQEARMGLALFYPFQSYIEAQPIKLFEYMAAGLPVIAADFPGFRKIVEENRCGFCVPSLDVQAIAEAIAWILGHQAEAEKMGQRGRNLVLRSFNWERESLQLLRFYERILGAH